MSGFPGDRVARRDGHHRHRDAEARRQRGDLPNRYPGKCAHCGDRVAPGQGATVKGATGWIVWHTDGTCQ